MIGSGHLLYQTPIKKTQQHYSYQDMEYAMSAVLVYSDSDSKICGSEGQVDAIILRQFIYIVVSELEA